MACFVTFEGPEGSGKTTQVQLLHRELACMGYPVLLVREPGSTSIGEQIRQVLHDVRNVEMQPNAEVLLYSASRAQLVGQVIRPALKYGKVVLCDRYAESTMAYQGYGHQLDLDLLRAITAFATGGLRPDLIVYLDVEVDEGLRRKRLAHAKDGSEWNRMDQKELDFHRRVREGYLQLAAADAARWFKVDAGQEPDAVQADVRSGVMHFFAQRGIRPSP